MSMITDLSLLKGPTTLEGLELLYRTFCWDWINFILLVESERPKSGDPAKNRFGCWFESQTFVSIQQRMSSTVVSGLTMLNLKRELALLPGWEYDVELIQIFRAEGHNGVCQATKIKDAK
jgi:hypothetical protein